MVVSAYTCGKFLYVIDLGADAIYHFEVVEAGKAIKKTGETACTAGAGPRHMCLDLDNSLIYLNNELEMSCEVLSVDKATGAGVLAVHAKLAGLPSPPTSLSAVLDDGKYPEGVTQKGAEMELSPCKKFLYVSHRGTGAMVAYEVLPAAQGYLRQVQSALLTGNNPRMFILTPSGSHAIVALQDKDGLELHRIGGDGKLTRVSITDTAGLKPAAMVIN